MSEMSIGDFKAKASEILRKVETDKEAVTITRRGKPVARIVPLDEATPAQGDDLGMEALGSLFGQMTKMMESLGGTGKVEVTTTPTTPAAKPQSRRRKE